MNVGVKGGGKGRQGGYLLSLRAAVCALAFCAALLSQSRPARAQIFCEFFIVPPIATGITILVNNALINAVLSPSDGELPDLMNKVTMAVMGYTAGDVGVGAAAAIGGGAAAGIQIPGFSTTPGLGSIPFLSDALNFATHSPFYGGLGFMDDVMRYRLDKFWNDFQGALRGLSQQVQASSINNARLLASIEDSGGLSASALFHQESEIAAKRHHVPSNQACQFDTAANSFGAARSVSVAAGVGFSQQMNEIGNNTVDPSSAPGDVGFRNKQFRWYLNNGCDINSNGGQSPCAMMREPQGPVVPGMSFIKPAFAQTPPPQPPQANAASSPDVSLFNGVGTIDVSDPEVLNGLHYLMTNLVGCTPPPTIPPSAMNTASGIEKFQRIRKYVTRCDALSALISGVIGDYMPAGNPDDPVPGESVQEARMKMGITTASETPSMHEMLMSLIDSLNDPNYYMDLGAAGGTIGQKEIFLKAYNNMLLFNIIEKQEKLAGAYAIETVHMLERMKMGRRVDGKRGKTN